MAQTAMHTTNPGMRSVVVAGISYPVSNQIATVNDDHIAHMRSLGFTTAEEANLKAAEVKSAADAEPAAKDARIAELERALAHASAPTKPEPLQKTSESVPPAATKK